MNVMSLPLEFRASRTRRRGHGHDALPEIRPEYVFDFSAGGSFSREIHGDWPIKPFNGQEMVLDASHFATLAQRPLHAIEVDWLRLASALYSADRFAPRRLGGPNGPVFWRRSIQVVVPVFEPGRWNAIALDIMAALEFLTEDDWLLRFVRRGFHSFEEDQAHFSRLVDHRLDWVALFSGGLDSTAGALHWLHQPGGRGLLVSGYTNSRLHDSQLRVVEQMYHTFHQRVGTLPVEYGLPFKIEPSGLDSSQRCRAWMHVSLGLLAAHIAGLNRLHVFENGIGAFNLPCEVSQTGSKSSRAMHPIFLARIARVASEAFGTAMNIEQPFALATKAEMLRNPHVRHHQQMLADSFSCEIFPNYLSRERQCGVCPSCLIRRMSLHVAGIADKGSAYSWDVLSHGPHPELRKGAGFMKLERLAHRLQSCVRLSSTWDSLIAEFPHFALVSAESARTLRLSEADFAEYFVRLQREFVNEWNTFADAVLRSQLHSLSLAA